MKGFPQLRPIRRTRGTPLTDATAIMTETVDQLYRDNWASQYEARQDWLHTEKQRVFAAHEAALEERSAFKFRRELARREHWLQIKLERSMMKATIAAKNQEELKRRNEIKAAARLELVQALNEEVSEFYSHPDEAINRRFLTFGYKRWLK